jgi:hypothetical protein
VKTRQYLKRMAAHIAAELPEDDDEALAVLDLARQVVLILSGRGAAPASGNPQGGPVAELTRLAASLATHRGEEGS